MALTAAEGKLLPSPAGVDGCCMAGSAHLIGSRDSDSGNALKAPTQLKTVEAQSPRVVAKVSPNCRGRATLEFVGSLRLAQGGSQLATQFGLPGPKAGAWCGKVLGREALLDLPGSKTGFCSFAGLGLALRC